MKKSVAASEKPVKAKEFDKELFKRSVEYNVRTLYRKNLEEADAQQIRYQSSPWWAVTSPTS